MPESRHILFRLHDDEIAALHKQLGEGGFQQKFLSDSSRLDRASGEIRLTDRELGKIIRYCSYGPGGFQSDLRLIFARSIGELLSGKREK